MGLPAHSLIEGSEKSGCCTAFERVAVRYGCIGRRRSKHLPHTFCGLSGSVSSLPQNQCAAVRWLHSVPLSGWSSALELQHRMQKICPHWRQWWRRVVRLNSVPQRMQLGAASSGSHSALPSVFGGSGGPVYT